MRVFITLDDHEGGIIGVYSTAERAAQQAQEENGRLTADRWDREFYVVVVADVDGEYLGYLHELVL